MKYDGVAVLIPAYKPDDRLVQLVKVLSQRGFRRLVVVDDGGGEDFQPIFQRLEGRAEVLTHPVNRGKGAALKTGLSHIQAQLPGVGVVTADADGQHTPEDIERLAQALTQSPEALILGVRRKSEMPLRSKAGNTLTCVIFGAMTGMWVSDTQTGLRGLPAQALSEFCQLEGERYEYEINMLVSARQQRLRVVELPIATVYIDGNRSSHFRPLQDGLRIYAQLFRQLGSFAGSSLAACLVDYGLFTLINLLLRGRAHPDLQLWLAVAGARVVSSLVNYFLNQQLVFRKRQSGWGTFVRYYLLVALVMLLNYLIILGLTDLGLGKLFAKLIADGALFAASYKVQDKLVFRPKKRGR